MWVHSAIRVLCLTIGVSTQAAAQACLELRRDEIRALTAPDAPGRPGGCTTSCKGCGCRGGPGYRDDRGKCVGYRELISRCGEAPHAGCTRECFPVVQGCSKPDIDAAKQRAATERERIAIEAEKARAKGQ